MTLLHYATTLTGNPTISRDIIVQAWLFMVEVDGNNGLLVAEIRRRCYEFVNKQR